MGAERLSSIIRSRRSVRSYVDRPVDRSVLEDIFDVVRMAPSARNRQCWRFVIVDDRDMIRRIAGEGSTSTFVARAPVVVAAVATEPGHLMRCGADASDVDLSIALDHLQLVAWSMGIGSCWLGSFDEPAVRGLLGVPDGQRIVSLMSLGYPEGEAGPPSRRPLRDVISFNTFSGE